MNVKEEKINDIVVCILEGEININTSPDLRKVFEKLIKNNEKKIAIDFSNITYIDSSGLATLIEMLQRLRKIGGKLRLANMSENIRNVFEITKLTKLFEIFDTTEAALKDF
ncbi:MAG: STAS domain-containing protein [Candidatus Omnitrophica bacterium]|nr:STAS domain-containing protein [Candidatus Omnitrophota bacterium]